MSVTLHTVRATDGRFEVVECYLTLDDCIGDLALYAWEEPGNRWLDVIKDDDSGEAIAVAIFGPGHELLVTCSDGRRLAFEMPESYRNAGCGGSLGETP